MFKSTTKRFWTQCSIDPVGVVSCLDSGPSPLQVPTELFLTSRRAELALLLQVVSLLKMPLSGVAAENGGAVLVNAIAEVLTGHANTGSPQGLKVSVIDKNLLSHGYLRQ